MADSKSKSGKMWGGRFSTEISSLVEEYTSSIDFDAALARQDIQGSKAHARMLAKQNILTSEELELLITGLETIEKELHDSSFAWRRDMEDVHMNMEYRLTELVGEVGKKLHTGRSRNDQVALDFRLYVHECVSSWRKDLLELVSVLIQKAGEHAATILPGVTHLQPAQPVSLAHHLLAYAQMFKRDIERIEDARKRIAVSPLGAAALAGTTYPLDPSHVAREVGFDDTFANSMDAVSDRDFVAEGLFIAGLVMMHLSKLCEELILWAAPAFGFVHLPDNFATGSSIMPQKKNPDVAEIMRGKTGRVYGSLMGLLTTLKGLPMTYNRDLQEDKEPFFDTHKTVSPSVKIMAEMLSAVEFDAEAMQQSLKKGFVNATELADYLAVKGMPFREAHAVTGKAVAYAEKQGKGLEDLTLPELESFSDIIEEDVFAVLDYAKAVSRRETPGGTGPKAVRNQMDILYKWLKSRTWDKE